MPQFHYDILHNKHSGDIAYIVGKGPSLQYISYSCFSVQGPVIVLNDAIMEIETSLPYLNCPIYSLQKDGHPNFMYKPSKETFLILQSTEGYSKEYYREHKKRIVIDPVKDQGFDHPQVMAIRMAISMAVYMGCAFINLLCCDSLTSEDYRTYNPRTGASSETDAAKFYRLSKTKVLQDLRSVKHEFITPIFYASPVKE